MKFGTAAAAGFGSGSVDGRFEAALKAAAAQAEGNFRVGMAAGAAICWKTSSQAWVMPAAAILQVHQQVVALRIIAAIAQAVH